MLWPNVGECMMAVTPLSLWVNGFAFLQFINISKGHKTSVVC